MERLYLVADKAEIDRRRAGVEPGLVVEAWQDLPTPDRPPSGLVWLGEDAKRALDAAGAEPIPHLLAVEETAVPVYYGPRLADVESLPGEASLRARVLSAHGIAVACITYDQFGASTEYQPASPIDPVFLLRRAGTRMAHRWRLFRSRQEAIVYMTEFYGKDAEARDWAEAIPADDFAELLRRFGQPA